MPRERAVPLLVAHGQGSIATSPSMRPGLGLMNLWVCMLGGAVRAGSFCDGMPVSNEKGDVTLVFSGERYIPQPGKIRGLKDRSHSYDDRSAAHLVHLYEDDPSFFIGLNGLFHGLVVDQKRGTATLFTDHYGMHRLCYHQSKEAFYFAAEAKAILAVLPDLKEADPRSIGEFVSCSCILENRTIFKNIQVLPAASAWVFRNGAIESKNTYFEPSKCENQEPIDPESYYRELRDVFSRNLPLYFSDTERTGMTLTGGMDTRMIMAWHNAAPGSLPCYTFGGTLRDCEDVRIARRIANLCKQPHEVIPMGEEFLSQFSPLRRAQHVS